MSTRSSENHLNTVYALVNGNEIVRNPP